MCGVVACLCEGMLFGISACRGSKCFYRAFRVDPGMRMFRSIHACRGDRVHQMTFREQRSSAVRRLPTHARTIRVKYDSFE